MPRSFKMPGAETGGDDERPNASLSSLNPQHSDERRRKPD